MEVVAEGDEDGDEDEDEEVATEEDEDKDEEVTAEDDEDEEEQVHCLIHVLEHPELTSGLDDYRMI